MFGLPRPGRQERRVSFDLNPLDDAAGLLDIGHGAADRGLKTVGLAVKADVRRAAECSRRAIVFLLLPSAGASSATVFRPPRVEPASVGG